MFGIIRIGLSFLPLVWPVGSLAIFTEDSLSQPLGGSSRDLSDHCLSDTFSGWSLRRVLQVIEDRRSASALRRMYII